MSNDNSVKKLNRKAFIAGTFFVLTQLIVRGITFLTTPIYTRLVSTAQYGQIRIYESWLLILVPISSLCLYRSVERAKYDYGDKFEEYVSSVQTLSYISIAVFYIIISLFFKKSFLSFSNMNDFMFVIMILYTFFYTATLYYQRREKQMMRYKHSTMVTMLTMIPATVLSIALLYWGNVAGYENYLVDLRIGGFYLPQIIGGIAVAIIMWQSGRSIINVNNWKYALAYSLPLIPEMLSIQLMNQSDKIMIQKLVNEEAAGIFALATTVSFIIWIIEDSVWNAWLPWLYEKIARGEERDIKKPWDEIVLIFGCFSWLLVFFAPEIILILGGAKYESAKYLVAPMVTGTLLRFFSYIYTAIQNYYKKTAYVAGGTVAVMIINIILNYVCIIRLGYQAAAYTTAISYLILLIIQGLLERKVVKTRITSLTKMITASILIFAVNLLTMVSFDWKWYVRYIIGFIVIVAMAVKMLPKAKGLLKQK